MTATKTIAYCTMVAIALAFSGCDKSTSPTNGTQSKDSVGTPTKSSDSSNHKTNFQLIINAEIPKPNSIPRVEFVWISPDSIAHVSGIMQSTSTTTFSSTVLIDSTTCASDKCFGFVRIFDSTSSYYTSSTFFTQQTGILSYKSTQFNQNTITDTFGLSLVPNDSSASKWQKAKSAKYLLDTFLTYDTLLTDTIDYSLGNDFQNLMKGGAADNVTAKFSKSFDSLAAIYGYCFVDTLSALARVSTLPAHIDSLKNYMYTNVDAYKTFIPLQIRYSIDAGCFRTSQFVPNSVYDTISLSRSFHQVILDFVAKNYLLLAPTDTFSIGVNRTIWNIPKNTYWEIGNTTAQNILGSFSFTRHVTNFKATYVYRTRHTYFRKII